ncbi:hypothetical protein ACFU99_08885 [Streptomyces sp. NPDC057654]|uniref:hypothetical protein n=1 Tax=Streptomyces sp. NPDC057654 TaxID=3346196 RepID=UPI0036B0725D
MTVSGDTGAPLGRRTVLFDAGAPLGNIARRRRALAHLEPIFDLHLYRTRNPSTVEWSAYDVISLVLHTVDFVAVSAGFQGTPGPPRSTVLTQLADLARRMAPERPRSEHERVADYVLDHLLRHEYPTHEFKVVYANADNGWAQEAFPVKVLTETFAADGHTILVNVDDKTVALLLVAVDRPLEEQQEAIIAILRAQTETGQLAAAIMSAKEALLLSRAYAMKVRRLIGDAERDVSQVGYLHRLRPELAAAAQHLQRRITIDGTLLRHLENLVANASQEHDPAAVGQLAEAAARLDEAVETIAALHTDVIAASPRWRAAQAAQAFGHSLVGEINPTADVLVPLLRKATFSVGRDLTPLTPSILFDVDALVGRLVAPPRNLSDLGVAQPVEGPLDDMAGIYEQFPEQFHEVTDSLRTSLVRPGGQARLSRLLDGANALFARPESALVDHLAGLIRADADTARLRLRLLLVYEALKLWRPDGHPEPRDEWWAIDDGSRRDVPDLRVPDLIIFRKGGRP